MGAPDEPRDRYAWTDGRLDDLAHQVRAFAPTVNMVITHQANIDELKVDVAEFKAALTEVEQRLCGRIDKEAKAQEGFRREYREDREKEQQSEKSGGWLVRSSWIGGGAVVIGSLITAIVSILHGA